MKKQNVAIYSDASNVAVMRHPGRSYPGSLIQGDSLFILRQLANKAKEELERGNSVNAGDALEELVELLDGHLNHYESVLKEHGIQLPYVRNT
jgi:hypothetical protein